MKIDKDLLLELIDRFDKTTNKILDLEFQSALELADKNKKLITRAREYVDKIPDV